MKKIVMLQKQKKRVVYISDYKIHSQQIGITIIELLFSLSLSLILIAIVFDIYLASQKSLNTQSVLNALQDNATQAISILKSELHQAGYIGCAKLTVDFPLVSHSAVTLTPENKMMGSSNKITIKYASFPTNTLLTNMQNETVMILDEMNKVMVGNILLISDCQHAEIFKVQQVKHKRYQQTVMADTPLNYRYAANAEVSQLKVNHYFIAKTKRKDKLGNPIYSLFSEDIKHRKHELVEGIQQIIISYTLNRDGILTDVSAQEVDSWAKVAGVGIELTLKELHLQKTWFMYTKV